MYGKQVTLRVGIPAVPFYFEAYHGLALGDLDGQGPVVGGIDLRVDHLAHTADQRFKLIQVDAVDGPAETSPGKQFVHLLLVYNGALERVEQDYFHFPAACLPPSLGDQPAGKIEVTAQHAARQQYDQRGKEDAFDHARVLIQFSMGSMKRSTSPAPKLTRQSMSRVFR